MAKKLPYIDVSERKLLLRFFDVLSIVLSLSLASKFTDFSYIDIDKDLIYIWFLVLAIYFLFIGQILQIYNLKVSNNRFLIFRGIIVTSFITTLVYVFSPFVTPSLPENRLQIVYFYFLITIPVIIWRFLYISVLFSPKYFKTIILIGHDSISSEIKEVSNIKNLHNIAAYISNKKINDLSNFRDIQSVNLSKLVKENNVTEIIISTIGFSSNELKHINNELIELFEEGINVKGFETYYEQVTQRLPIEFLDFDFYKKINLNKNSNNHIYLFSQRFFDILISVIGLLIFIGFFPLFLIGNLFGNYGPLFYIQERVGYQGKIFKMYKLRSMVKNAEENGAVWAKKNDQRVTSFGKFLRSFRLDELPQLINIIKGDMSLIGPRPERPNFVEKLKESIPFYTMRHVVRPGLTGWAQVNFPYANTIEEQEVKLRYDLYYIKERSTFLDFKILIKTISTVLFFKGQ